ncbi:MAG: lipid-A-disaccharide synthase [Candidatus Omnitrophota bacterium]|nr:lipid-A-disaccharide synthase [Candidatus Omnitrophota bacterium]MDZ4241669.1 lipid-A-disaccharide synthase [Candidatus Omnitrophota bacterium]
MTHPAKHIFIIAGEASGDIHAAHLVAALKALSPDIRASGLGGRTMKDGGVELFEDLTRFAVVGFVEVLKHYGEFRRIFDDFLRKAEKVRPDCVILVDYPGFNLRMARELKKRGIPVVYYISPQVWAWKENRVRLMKEFTDLILVLFRFEKDFYAKHGVPVEWVGHPLIDQLPRPRAEVNRASPVFGLLPGSRHKEVQNLLPPMLKAARLIRDQIPSAKFTVLKAGTIPQKMIEDLVLDLPFKVDIVRENVHDALNRCDACLVASGTATLETAVLNKPMIVVYRTAVLTWVLARLLIKIPCIGLVNVVAGEKIVPECIQFQATGPAIARELLALWNDETRFKTIKSRLEDVRASLGPPGASARAAQAVLKLLSGNGQR